MNKSLIKVSLPLIAVMLFATSAFAQGGSGITAQSFGVYYGQYITGVEATVWTAQQPAGWYAIASPVGVCVTNYSCQGSFFETGYVKGTVSTQQNVLQQYISYWNGSGSIVNLWGYGNLNNNTWYTFRTNQCGPSGQWCIYRNGTSVGSVSGIVFNNGLSAFCGGEGGGAGVPMGVECSNLKWRDMPYSGSNWWSYNYNWTQIRSTASGHQYCLTPTSYNYGSISWKC